MRNRISFMLKENGEQNRVPRLVRLIEMCHLSILPTSWWQYTQKYCPFLSFSPTVRRYATHQRNVQFLFTYKVENCCIPTTRLYLTRRKVTCVDNQYHAITYRGCVNVSCRGNAVTTTRQTSDMSMDFYPRNESWKQCEDYSLDFLYNEQLLMLYQTHKSRKRGVSLPFFWNMTSWILSLVYL